MYAAALRASASDPLIVHASARDDHDSIVAHTPADQLSAMFAGARERVIVRAHNHAGQIRLWGERTIVTAGSVGLPLDANPAAQYLVMERGARGWRFEHHAVPYDLRAALRRFHETGYLDATGPMGRLFMREVATASFQVVPFLRAYRRWAAEEPLTLDQAFERFRNEF